MITSTIHSCEHYYTHPFTCVRRYEDKYRCYTDVARALGCELDPVVGLDVRERGHYMVHSERGGCAHCVAVIHNDAGIRVYSGDTEWTCSLSDLEDTSSICVLLVVQIVRH